MSHRRIPERAPIGDYLEGALIKSDDRYVVMTPLDSVPASAERLASGVFTVRYALPYLGKPQFAIVPGLVALDYGEILTGEEAWHFILKRSNLHPRADVLGYRIDGADDMISIKWLDLALPVRVFLFRDAVSVVPLAELAAIISPPDQLPARLLEYLPCYPTLADWRGALADSEEQ